MKLKDLVRQVLNEHEELDIDSLIKEKNRLLQLVEPLVSLKKDLYSNIDISQPKSKEEKELDNQVAKLYSDINQIVIKIQKILKSDRLKNVK